MQEFCWAMNKKFDAGKIIARTDEMNITNRSVDGRQRSSKIGSVLGLKPTEAWVLTCIDNEISSIEKLEFSVSPTSFDVFDSMVMMMLKRY